MVMTARAVRYWDEALETMPWDLVGSWQAARVAEFVEGLRHRSPLYKQLLPASPRPVATPVSLAFLGDLPFTTRDHLRRTAERPGPGEPLGGHQGVPFSEIVQTVSSWDGSGRGRGPAYSGLTVADLAAWRDAVACVFWTAGIRPDDVVGHLVALPGGPGGLPYADGFRQIGATLAWLGGLPAASVIESIRRLGVNALLASDTQSDRTAQELRIRKLLILTEGDDGPGEVRRDEDIGRGRGVTDRREIMGAEAVLPALWSECGEQAGMHFCGQRHVTVELVDPDPERGGGVPWEDGACGEVVYTTFDRQATPVLRLRSADQVMVTGAAGECPCGRTSPRVRRLASRN